MFSSAQGLVRLKDYFCFALNEVSLFLALLRLLLLLLLLLVRLRLLLLELSRQRLSQVVDGGDTLSRHNFHGHQFDRDITGLSSSAAEHDEVKVSKVLRCCQELLLLLGYWILR